MKKLKAYYSLLAISLGLMTMSANAATVTVPVVNNAWTFIGVPGFQTFGGTSSSSGVVWEENGVPTIIDASGTLGGTDYQVAGLEVPTWDGNISSAVTANQVATIDDSINSNEPRLPNSGAGVGTNVFGTVGLMVIGSSTDGTLDPKTSETDHAGARMAALRVDTLVTKSITSSIRTMYIQSADATSPDIKILYQANQEGNTFKIQYQISSASNVLDWENNTVYEGTFSRDYTYDNAAVLGDDFAVAVPDTTSGTAGNAVRNILHAFDMNLTDNNMTQAGKNAIEPNQDNSLDWTEYGDDFTSVAANDLRQPLDGNLTMLWYDTETQQWRQIRASNYSTASGHTGNPEIQIATDVPTTTSGLNKGDLEVGRGYWVKLEPNAASSGTSGFILGENTINHGLYTDANVTTRNYVGDGWNMLSFEDDYLSYSVTGMIAAYSATELNVTDTYGASTLQIDLTGTATATDACMVINASIDGNNTVGNTNTQVKCLADGSGNLILLSTRRFSIEYASVPTSLADTGTNLTAESNGSNTFYRSKYGEFAMLFEPNEEFMAINDGNMSVEFPVNSGDVGPVYSAVSTNAGTTATNLRTTAMGAATTGLSGAQNHAIEVDINFDGTVAGDAVLMASTYRFFIKDATQVRVFRYDNTVADANVTYGASNTEHNASFSIMGFGGRTDFIANTNGLVDDNLSGTALNIDNAAGTTGVNATVIDDTNTTLMLYYSGLNETHDTRAGVIDLQEWADGYDVLTEVPAWDENNETAKGAIKRVWQISSIVESVKDMNSTLEFDGNYSGAFTADVDDLRFNAYYAENFPTDGPLYNMKSDLGVKVESMITGQTATDGSFISWKQIDVSKPTEEWYDADDQYELFWTEKEKGYWVYINGTATNDLSIDTPTIDGDTYAHFNNRYSGAATSATTRNHLNMTLTVGTENLTSGGANANTDAFEVYATVGGRVTALQRSGATDDFTLLLNSHETNGVGFDEGEMEITITIAEGSGKRTSTTYVLDYEKPIISNIAIDGAEVTASVTNADAEEFHVYSGDINDSSYGKSGTTNWVGSIDLDAEDTVINLGSFVDSSGDAILGFATSFEENASAYLDPATTLNTIDEQIAEGIIRDVRVVAKDDAELYSNQQRLYYLPWTSGTGVLADSSTLGDSTYSSAPVVYNTDGTVDDTWTGNDGVQLSANGDEITCVYPHEDVEYTENTGESRLLVTTSGQTIGSVIYSPDLVGNPLVCQVGSNAYVTGFAAPGEGTSTDLLVMVPLSSKVSVSLTTDTE